MFRINNYKPRWLAERLREAIEFSPVVVLSGARQTGKSTLLQIEMPFKEWYFEIKQLGKNIFAIPWNVF